MKKIILFLGIIFTGYLNTAHAQRKRSSSYNSAFTLIQVSIILTMAALVMVSVLPGYQNNNAAEMVTTTRMNVIMNALRQYEVANITLPCPADPTIAIGNSS